MKSNEKLARNTIRVRKAIKKRSNEQDEHQRRDRLLKRIFALVFCLLLVSALVVPCFADYSNGVYSPAVDYYAPPEGGVIDIPGFGMTDVTNGYYLIVFDPNVLVPVLKDVSDGNLQIQLFDNIGDYLVWCRVTSKEYDAFDGPGFDTKANSMYFTQNGFYLNGIEKLSFNHIDGYVYPEVIYLLTDTYPLELTFRVADAVDVLPYTVYKVGYSDVETVSSVWTDVMTWITDALASIQSVFYLNGSLTFLGTLSIIGVSIALGWLIIGIVTRFFQLRG